MDIKGWVRTIVAIVAAIVAIYFGIANLNLHHQLFEVSLPYIIPIALTIPSNTVGLSFPVYIRNPSSTEYTINLSGGTCNFDTNLLSYGSSTNQKINNVSKNTNSINSVEINPNYQLTTEIIPPKNTSLIYCNHWDSKQIINYSINTTLDVCIKLIGISNKICGGMPITIIRHN